MNKENQEKELKKKRILKYMEIMEEYKEHIRRKNKQREKNANYITYSKTGLEIQSSQFAPLASS